MQKKHAGKGRAEWTASSGSGKLGVLAMDASAEGQCQDMRRQGGAKLLRAQF